MTLHPVLGRVAVAAHHLHALERDATRRLGHLELDHRRFASKDLVGLDLRAAREIRHNQFVLILVN